MTPHLMGALPQGRGRWAPQPPVDGGPVPLGPTAAHDTHRRRWGSVGEVEVPRRNGQTWADEGERQGANGI